MRRKLLLLTIAFSLPLGYLQAQEQFLPAYKSVAEVTIPVIIVPTVVEVPLNNSQLGEREVIVVEEVTGSVVASRYSENKEPKSTGVVITDDSNRNLSALNDADVETVVTFSLVNDSKTETVLEFNFDKPITSSQLQLSLGINGAFPNSIKISAADESTGNLVIVLAPAKVMNNRVPFLVTTSRSWSVTFEHSQPLRLSEISILEENTAYATEGRVRFLAQPTKTYKLYANADRTVSLQINEGGQLQNDEGVLELDLVSFQENSDYIPADIDEDSIIDIYDNCVTVANSDQEDIDKNERGDACDDFDRDGRINSVDNCRDIPNRNQIDTDGDGIGDACDEEESRLTEQNPWIAWVSLSFAGVAIAIMFFIVWSQSKREDDVVNEEKEAELLN